GGRVHGDQHVEVVAGGEDRKRGEVQLECADARQRAGGGADLGGEIGQRREVVAGERGLGRELRAGDLHAVARVTRKADDDRVAALLALRDVKEDRLAVPIAKEAEALFREEPIDDGGQTLAARGLDGRVCERGEGRRKGRVGRRRRALAAGCGGQRRGACRD